MEQYNKINSIKPPYMKPKYPYSMISELPAKLTYRTVNLYYDQIKKAFVMEQKRAKKGGEANNSVNFRTHIYVI
jgi:hypothetical protein